MDQGTDFNKALRLLQTTFGMIDISGRIFYLNNDNVAEVLTGNGNPQTTRLKFYQHKDIKIQQERMLEASDLALHPSDFKELQTTWLRSPATKHYRGTDFHPTLSDPEILNIWRGPIKGAEGNCDFLNQFLLSVICDGSEEKYDYLVKLLAHAVQKPEEKPGVMTVLCGNQGTGKGSFFKLLRSIWPYTTLLVQDVREVVGTYTGGLEGAFIVTMDEAVFNKDKKSANHLKTKISEDTMRIEEKYQPSRTVSSFHRFFAATNEHHWAPTDSGDRRMFVLQVSDKYKQDTKCFATFNQVLNDGVTVPAFVHKLANIDLSGFQVRHRPKTSEHARQVLESLPEFTKFMIDVLAKKNFSFSGTSLSDDWTGPMFIPTKDIKQEFIEYHPNSTRHGGITDKQIMSDLRRLIPSIRSKRADSGVGEEGQRIQARGVYLPDSEVARTEILQSLEIDEWIIDWEEPELIRTGLIQYNGTSVTSGTEPNRAASGHVPWDGVAHTY